MKTSIKLILVIQLGALTGCTTWGTDNHAAARATYANRLMVNSFFDEAAENGIIAQHTIFPYHFVVDGDQLNALGRSDLGVLAAHFKETPGPLNVRRAGASEDLYKARVAAVMAFLGEQGVNPDRVRIGDAVPGGPGMASDRVISALSRKETGKPGQTKADGQFKPEGPMTNASSTKAK